MSKLGPSWPRSTAENQAFRKERFFSTKLITARVEKTFATLFLALFAKPLLRYDATFGDESAGLGHQVVSSERSSGSPIAHGRLACQP